MTSDDPAELFDAILDAWRHRADTYERLNHEAEAAQVRGCIEELEMVLDETTGTRDTDSSRGDAELSRTNPAGLLHVTVTASGDEVYSKGTTGFTVYRTDQNEYEVRL